MALRQVHSSQPFKGINRDTLKVLHWNADGLSTKWPELNECLKKADIDIALIQETKYKNNTKLPAFPGYAPIRYDRDGDGGGLLCLIKHNIPLYIPKYCKQTVGGVESISFESGSTRGSKNLFQRVHGPQTGGWQRNHLHGPHSFIWTMFH